MLRGHQARGWEGGHAESLAGFLLPMGRRSLSFPICDMGPWPLVALTITGRGAGRSTHRQAPSVRKPLVPSEFSLHAGSLTCILGP